jgi:hypothetical protein
MIMKYIKPGAVLAVMLLVLITLFTSCDKNDDGPQCLLSTMNNEWVKDCDGDIESNSRQISFTYDSTNRLTKWAWSNGGYVLFEYNSSGKLVKAEELWEDELSYVYFTWDGNKVTRQMYWEEEPDISKSTIEFNSKGEVVRVEGFNNYEGDWILEWYETYTWKNGNLLKVELYSLELDFIQQRAGVERMNKPLNGMLRKSHRNDAKRVSASLYRSQGSDFVLTLTTTFTYDDKQNPLSIHPALSLWDVWSPLFKSKNNVVSWVELENHQGEDNTWSASLRYDYNNQEFPYKLTIEVEDECHWTEIIEYKYTNCD